MVTPCTYYRSGTAQFSWQFHNESLTGIFFLHFLVPSRRREGKTLAAARAAPPTSLPLSPVATRPGFVRARPARCRRGECSSPLERVYDVGCYPIFSKRSRRDRISIAKHNENSVPQKQRRGGDTWGATPWRMWCALGITAARLLGGALVLGVEEARRTAASW
jgi:hypothetical protein